MEKKTGFRECPKCGLRNKPSAVQCDFCGQNLGEADDWQEHLKDLESLNKMEFRRPMDERTSRRIEATIIRKDVVPSKGVGIRDVSTLGKAFQELEANPPVRERKVEEKRPKPSWADDEGNNVSIKGIPRAGDVESVTLDESVEDAGPVSSEPPSEPALTVAPIEKTEAASSSVDDLSVSEPEEERVSRPTEAETSETDVPPVDEGPVGNVSGDEGAEGQFTAKEEPEDLVISEENDEVTLEVESSQPSYGPEGSEDAVPQEPSITVTSNSNDDTVELRIVEVQRETVHEASSLGLVDSRITKEALPAVVVLAIGISAYLIILGLTAFGILDATVSIGGGAVSSVMMIYGASVIYPSLKKKEPGVVFICPRCHERVDEERDVCPTCGASFDPED